MNKSVMNCVWTILAAGLVMSACDKEPHVSRHGSTIRVIVNTQGATKTVAMTTDGLKGKGAFVMDAFLDDEAVDETEPGNTKTVDQHYIVSAGVNNVSYSNGSWALNKDYYWVANDLTRFWCYWPQDSEVDGVATVDGSSVSAPEEGVRTITSAPVIGGDSMSFDYTLPTAAVIDTDDPFAVTVTDAENQKDILFAYSEKTFTNGDDDGVSILFKHALSQIRFCVSPTDATFDVSLSIERITIKGVDNSGSCEFDNENGGTFTWSAKESSPATSKSSYTQDYRASFSTTSAPEGWTSGTYEKKVDGITTTHKLYTCNNSFMMIPQELSENEASLEVTFGNTGTGLPITVEVPLPVVTWKAGYYYTYKIVATTIGRTIVMSVVLDGWGNYDDRLIVPLV